MNRKEVRVKTRKKKRKIRPPRKVSRLGQLLKVLHLRKNLPCKSPLKVSVVETYTSSKSETKSPWANQTNSSNFPITKMPNTQIREMALFQAMEPTLIRVSSEIIMRIGSLSFWILWSPSRKTTRVSTGQSAHSSASMMAMEEQCAPISWEITSINSLLKMRIFHKILFRP